METEFIKMDKRVQEKLAYFREIFTQPENNSDIDIIGLRYTIPRKDDPYEEKIRNLRVSLAGKWKLIYLTEIYGVEGSNKAFFDFCHMYNRSRFDYNLHLRWLYSHPTAKDFSVKARNFNEGVNALFEMTTEEYPSDRDLLQFRLKSVDYRSLPILIRQSGDGKHEYCDAYTWWTSGLYDKNTKVVTSFRPMYSLERR